MLSVRKKQMRSLFALSMAKEKDSGSGYKTLAEILLKFEEIGRVPIEVPLSCLDDGSGTEEMLRSNRAL